MYHLKKRHGFGYVPSKKKRRVLRKDVDGDVIIGPTIEIFDLGKVWSTSSSRISRYKCAYTYTQTLSGRYVTVYDWMGRTDP